MEELVRMPEIIVNGAWQPCGLEGVLSSLLATNTGSEF